MAGKRVYNLVPEQAASQSRDITTPFLAGILVLAAIAYYFFGQYIAIGVAVILLIAFFATRPSIIELKEYERAVVFRFGRFYAVEGPGLMLHWHVLEKYVLVDLRDRSIDIPPQAITSRDNVKITVDAIVFCKIIDPKKIVIEVRDYEENIKKFLYASIRNAFGKMNVEEILEQTEEVNAELKEKLAELAKNWGLQVTSVEIESIQLPAQLIEAMQKTKEAEEFKLRVRKEAEARQDAIDILDKATSKMAPNTITYLYLDALKKISQGKSNKIIFPLEMTKLANALSSGIESKDKSSLESIAGKLLKAYSEKKK